MESAQYVNALPGPFRPRVTTIKDMRENISPVYLCKVIFTEDISKSTDNAQFLSNN